MNTTIRPLAFVLLLASSLPMAAQTCNPNAPLSKPDSRYTDNGDGTVTDMVTGLMWRQCPEGLSSTNATCDAGSAVAYTWQEALARAQTVNGTGFAGHNDWRLPNVKELMSLSESACQEPAINLTLFPVDPLLTRFWSSTPIAPHTGNQAWGVEFASGFNRANYKEYADHVRLVRGGR
jgi:hypothetical protein